VAAAVVATWELAGKETKPRAMKQKKLTQQQTAFTKIVFRIDALYYTGNAVCILLKRTGLPMHYKIRRHPPRSLKPPVAAH